MSSRLVVGLVVALTVAPVLADKPEWAGEGKPSLEQKEAHKEAMKAKGEYDDDGYLSNDKKEKQKKAKKEKKLKDSREDDLSGLDKQKIKKAEQERKELGKGAESGQEGRDGSKKWWKFWE